jgi:LAO/AO transport system kinase
MQGSGELRRKRQAQQVQWMWDMIEDGLRKALRGDPELAALTSELQDAVARGKASPSAAAWRVLARFADRAGDALKRG